MTQIPMHRDDKGPKVASFTRMMSKASGPIPRSDASSLDHQAAVDSCICMHGCSRSRAATSNTPVDQLPLRSAFKGWLCLRGGGSSATICQRCVGLDRRMRDCPLQAVILNLLPADLSLDHGGPVRECRVSFGSTTRLPLSRECRAVGEYVYCTSRPRTSHFTANGQGVIW